MTAYKASGNLKKLLTTTKSGRLIPHLERWLMSQQPEPRDYTYLHPSDICKDNWCQRSAWFQLTGHPYVREVNQLSRHNMFQEGHLIHAKWQKYFHDMGVLYGNWTDTDGKTRHSCLGEPDWKYQEVSLEDRTIMMRGRSDGWIVGLGDDCLIEIKSVGIGTLRFESPGLLTSVNSDIDKAWNEIKSPFPSHLRQGQIYLELAHRMEKAGELTRPAPKEIVFIYEYKANQSYKEFVVPYKPEVGDRFMRRAERVTEAVRNMTEMECNNNPGGRCSSCVSYE